MWVAAFKAYKYLGLSCDNCKLPVKCSHYKFNKTVDMWVYLIYKSDAFQIEWKILSLLIIAKCKFWFRYFLWFSIILSRFQNMLNICYLQAWNEVNISSESDFPCCIWDNVLIAGHTWPFSWHQLTSLHCPFPLLLQPNEEYNDVVWDLPHHEHRPGETDGCLQTHSLPCWSTKRYSVMIRYNAMMLLFQTFYFKLFQTCRNG